MKTTAAQVPFSRQDLESDGQRSSPNVQRFIKTLFPFFLSLFLGTPLGAQDPSSPPASDVPVADAPPASIPAAATFVPTDYPIERYQKLRGKSPFEFELAKPVVETAADPFADLVLAGYAGSASRPTVYVVNTKTQERLTILPEGSAKKDASGFRVLSINRGRNLVTTTVKIEKDGVQKELAFDPKALSNMTASSTGGQPGSPPPFRPGTPGMSVPPNISGQMPRPGVPAQPAATYKSPAAFIPTNNNRANGQINNPGGQALPNGLQLGNPSGQPFNPGSTDAQQQLNNMLNNSSNPGIQLPGTPGLSSQNGQPPIPQPRRRVVLPSP